MVIIIPEYISLVCIAIIIGALVAAYVKKFLITYALVITNIIIFVITFINPSVIYNQLGFKPIYLSLQYFPQIYTLFTSMFVHGGVMHLIGNMIVFFFMGMAFPIGMKIASNRSASLTPWLWGINGATSVCASVVAVAIALSSSISTSFWTGFSFYAVAFLAFLGMSRGKALHTPAGGP